jgi:two-component system alkaline phosphatase synthesis response regulator PhoP
VTTAGNGADALALARTDSPDLIVLDLGLPKMDGLDVTRALRKHSNVPIIMLTARVDESDKLIGLELGADDYLTKPFSPRELVARVRAVFRRTDIGPGAGDVIAPRMSRSTYRECASVSAGRSTHVHRVRAARHADAAAGRVFTRGSCWTRIRGDQAESFDRAIDAHIKNLRRKLEPDPRTPSLRADRVRRRVQVRES